MDRLAMLQQFANTKPDDPFPRYGLAMEYKKLGRLQEASDQFDQLMANHPDYVATYLMAGNTLEARGMPQEAANVYRRGIAVADKARNEHAKGELEGALAAIDEGSA